MNDGRRSSERRIARKPRSGYDSTGSRAGCASTTATSCRSPAPTSSPSWPTRNGGPTPSALRGARSPPFTDGRTTRDSSSGTPPRHCRRSAASGPCHGPCRRTSTAAPWRSLRLRLPWPSRSRAHAGCEVANSRRSTSGATLSAICSAGASASSGRAASSASRAIHRRRHDSLIPRSFAIEATDAPGSRVNATARRRNSNGLAAGIFQTPLRDDHRPSSGVRESGSGYVGTSHSIQAKASTHGTRARWTQVVVATPRSRRCLWVGQQGG